MQQETELEPLPRESRFKRFPFWALGPILYVTGVLISLFTGNFERFLLDYPWACFSAAYMIGAWVGPYFVDRHRSDTRAIRSIFSISDEEFEDLLNENMRRITHPRNLLFGLVFLPVFLWAWTQRLWWLDYSSPFFFDLYYLLLLAFVLPPYVSVMFGAFVACHMNIYKLCEKTPLNHEYLLGEGKVILQRRWGGLIIRVTVFAFILSALTNVPVLLFSGEIGSLLNLVLALALTIVIFLFPHYMFHRMLEKSKDEMLLRVRKLQKEHGLARLEDLSKGAVDEQSLSAKLNLIFLAQYEWSLKVGSNWLVDLKAVVELLLVASIHVLFMEALSMFVNT